jgi:hypothetical protein
MKRRILLLAAGLAGLAVRGFVFGLWVTAPPHRIARVARHIYAVRRGSTVDEASADIGVPPGDYLTPGVEPPGFPPDPNGNVPLRRTTADWRTDGASVRLYLDGDGRVLFAGSECRMDPDTFWDRVRIWLGFR